MILLYIFVLSIYSVFYIALIPLFLESVIYGYSIVETIIYLGVLIFVTIHMRMMLKGINKTSKKLKEKRLDYRTKKQASAIRREEYFSKEYQDKVRNTSIDELRSGVLSDDCCGIEHDVPYGQRYCPFCGEKAKHEDAVCSICQHEI